jgi:hypothetical protein
MTVKDLIEQLQQFDENKIIQAVDNSSCGTMKGKVTEPLENEFGNVEIGIDW